MNRWKMLAVRLRAWLPGGWKFRKIWLTVTRRCQHCPGRVWPRSRGHKFSCPLARAVGSPGNPALIPASWAVDDEPAKLPLEVVISQPDEQVTVHQGQFVINSVDLTARGDGLLVYEIDTRSKYPMCSDNTGMGNDEPVSVVIFGGVGALRLDESKPVTDLTRVTLPARTGGWQVATDTGRYTVRIIAWQPGQREELWTRKDDDDD